jgi:hypothetical protein
MGRRRVGSVSEQAHFTNPLDCHAVAEGDIVTRILGGVVEMELVVNKVEGNLIHCGATDAPVDGWTFSRRTGFEVDEELEAIAERKGFSGVLSYIRDWRTP